ERIAAGGAPTDTTDAAISIGGFEIPSTADTYSEAAGVGDTIAGESGRIDISGKRSYTVLKSTNPPHPPFSILLGNGASTFGSKGEAYEAYETGAAGGRLDGGYTINIPGRYLLEVWGAKGADKNNKSKADSGKGGYSVGEIYLGSGHVLYLHAGGYPANKTGGYNGGGSVKDYGGAGGGASDIRVDGDTFYHRVIVAGGGGGGGNETWQIGGFGGGTDGGASNGLMNGKGGTQTTGGAAGVYTTGNWPHDARLVKPGTFGKGGSHDTPNINDTSDNGAAGGGGWYGGGAGSIDQDDGAGGGGSGWVNTANALTVFSASTDYASYALKDVQYHLTNAKTVNGSVTNGMPNPLDQNFDPAKPTAHGLTMTGNSRGGFVRITYLGPK
ncbi:MAG: hypothetical protein LBO70_07060, partial [Clostridiales Family XIII bacterium]|nr:hypothetical protein [Clostridiales Family XIII bacterium]